MRARWSSMAMMLWAAASYGLVTPLAKAAVASGVPVRLFTTYQYPAPLLVFGAAALISRRSQPIPVRHEWPRLILVGASAAATAVTYYQALRFLPASDAVVLLFQFAWMLPVMAWVVHRTPPTKRQWGAIFGVLLGTAIAGGLTSFHVTSWKGMALGLAAALSYAATLFWQARVPEGLSLWGRSLVSTAAGSVVAALAYRPWAIGVPQADGPGLFYGSIMGLVGLALPMSLTYLSAPRLGDARTAILASFELPVAVGLSHWWLHESIGLNEWVGVLLILLSIAAGAWPTPFSAPAS